MRNAVGVLGVMALVLGPAGAPAEADSLEAFGLIRYKESRPAPDFSLSDLNGKAVALRDLRGRLVLLNIWTTWCPACRDEMPSLERLHQEFGVGGVSILAASHREDPEEVRKFVGEFKLTMPVLLDQDGRVGELYGLVGLPTTFLIGPDGRLIARAIGPRDWDGTEARALIRALLQRLGTTR